MSNPTQRNLGQLHRGGDKWLILFQKGKRGWVFQGEGVNIQSTLRVIGNQWVFSNGRMAWTDVYFRSSWVAVQRMDKNSKNLKTGKLFIMLSVTQRRNERSMEGGRGKERQQGLWSKSWWHIWWRKGEDPNRSVYLQNLQSPFQASFSKAGQDSPSSHQTLGW